MRSSKTFLLPWVSLRPGHEHDSGKEAKEYMTHPSWHGMGLGCSVMHVKHKDGDDYGKCDEDHGKQEVLTNQWND